MKYMNTQKPYIAPNMGLVGNMIWIFCVCVVTVDSKGSDCLYVASTLQEYVL